MRMLAALLGLCLVTCSSPNELPRQTQKGAAVQPAARLERPAPVVLVTIDGVRWQDALAAVGEAEEGSVPAEMPVLRALITEHGAMLGAPGRGTLEASGPNFVSMPGYTELFTGRPSSCSTNECGRPEHATFLEELAARGAKVAVIASWERIGLTISRDAPSFFVSAGRPEGDTGNPWPGGGAYRPDERTMELALGYLQGSQPDVLVVGLGDTDEHAHHGDRAAYAEALARADAFLGRLQATLAQMGERGAETHVLVTTDHGRSQGFRDHGGEHPESARVWLAAAGPRIAQRGLVASRAHRLSDVAGTIVALSTREEAPGASSLSELLEP